jgi:hypothetical protein
MHEHTVGPLPARLGNRDCHTAQRLLITARLPAALRALPGWRPRDRGKCGTAFLGGLGRSGWSSGRCGEQGIQVSQGSP